MIVKLCHILFIFTYANICSYIITITTIFDAAAILARLSEELPLLHGRLALRHRRTRHAYAICWPLANNVTDCHHIENGKNVPPIPADADTHEPPVR